MTKWEIQMPSDLHPATQELVAKFASALARKLAAAEKKYGHSNDWADDDWEQECKQALIDHVIKGDPRDVAAYCAFMWHHDWKTSLNATVDIHP